MDKASAATIERLRTHVHVKGWGYAGPYRMGIAAGELGVEIEPWWPSAQARKCFRDGVVVGQERAIAQNQPSGRRG